jgi:hypothetical protein
MSRCGATTASSPATPAGAWNYKLMMDASGYLAAEEWPELVDREGLDARQNPRGDRQAALRRIS